MGALTLKNFPFEIRGWDIEKFESFDPTDVFGFNTKIYLNKNKIVQIEPDYGYYNSHFWITDKGRQFFDGTFESHQSRSLEWIKDNFWSNLWNKIIKVIYISDHCNKQKNQTFFFTIVSNNVSFETWSILSLIAKSYSFVKLKTIEFKKINIDLEADFQLNNVSKKHQLKLSTLCLLVSTNPKYEGHYLNLNLRQRVLKGNFKCLLIGALLDLTFPLFFLGSNTNIIQTILEGNNFLCQDIKSANNPLLIYNNELFKRKDGENILKSIKLLFYFHIFQKSWNGFNALNSSLSDHIFLTFKQFPKLTWKDLNNFSSLYFLGVSSSNFSSIQKIIELKVLKSCLIPNFKNPWFFDQSNHRKNKFKFFKKNFTNYVWIANNNFYDNQETYINTEGVIKRTTKVLKQKKIRNNWQILRKFLKLCDDKFMFLKQKENQMIFFNCQKFFNFKNFIAFQYYFAENLCNIAFYLSIRNKTFILNQKLSYFKYQITKLIYSKLKYWLDDFFCGGKDEYSQNSLALMNCSKILKIKATTFL